MQAMQFYTNQKHVELYATTYDFEGNPILWNRYPTKFLSKNSIIRVKNSDGTYVQDDNGNMNIKLVSDIKHYSSEGYYFDYEFVELP